MTLKPIGDAEEARIQVLIASDPDAPEATDEQLAQAAAMRKGGRPRSDTPKHPISLRLDAEVLACFKATGPGWQSRVNAIPAREMAKGR